MGNIISSKIGISTHLRLASFFYTYVHIITYCLTFKKKKIMNNILYIIAVILIIGWAVGFFAYSAGGLIHILLVIAIVAILLNIIRRA
jgi:Family of unknown function (DUF5670)